METSDFDKRYDAFRKYILAEYVECASKEQIWQWCYFNVVWDETIKEINLTNQRKCDM